MTLTQEEHWLLTEKYHGQKTEGFLADCVRLKAGEPLAYLIGSIPFLNTTIWLDSRPLIPRTETEYMVAFIIDYYQAHAKVPRSILDLCAGSGCIGVALGAAFPHTTLTLAEIDTPHHPTITKNCERNGISSERYTVFGGSLFDHIPAQKFDLIVSNPPYIDPGRDRTTPSVKQYEPAIALYGGTAGFMYLHKIIMRASAYLAPGGELWLEHEPEQSSAIAEAGAARYIVHTHQDQYAQERFSQLVLQ